MDGLLEFGKKKHLIETHSSVEMLSFMSMLNWTVQYNVNIDIVYTDN